MSEEFDALAFERARMDQTTAAGVELARMLVAFHKTLKAGSVDDTLAHDLTNSYFDALLDNARPDAPGDEDDE